MRALKHATHTTVISLAIGAVAVANAEAPNADQANSNGVDLPGVPVSITDPAESGPEESSTETAAAQQAAEEQLDTIREQLRAQGGDRTEPVDTGSGEASPPPGVNERMPGNQAPDARKIDVEPGVNEVIEISRGHPNRLVMPFHNPEVQTTTTEAEITVSGRVIYVATGATGPVTLFVHPEGQEELALSLTLLPRSIPPRSVQLGLDGPDSLQGHQLASPHAEDWETRSSYVDTLIDLFQSLAKQDLPDGYTLRDPDATDRPTCEAGRGESVDFQLGQVAEGHHIQVQVLVATNEGDRPVEIDGSYCAAPGVLAAAEWPRSVLEPGEQTEMFVALQRLEEREPETRRPSLIGE